MDIQPLGFDTFLWYRYTCMDTDAPFRNTLPDNLKQLCFFEEQRTKTFSSVITLIIITSSICLLQSTICKVDRSTDTKCGLCIEYGEENPGIQKQVPEDVPNLIQRT